MDGVFSNEECSSGCESGWTLYLDHSSIPPYNQEHAYLGERRSRVSQMKRLNQEEKEEKTEEDEDLSMVSDASSGPPHFHEEKGYGGNVDTSYQNDAGASLTGTRHKSKENQRLKIRDRSSLLDDTASSPLFGNKNFIHTRRNQSEENVLEYSQGYSSTQFEERRPYQEPYDFFQSPLSGNQLQQNQWNRSLSVPPYSGPTG